MHLVDSIPFHVVLVESSNEEDGSDILEAVYPFLPLTLRPSNIHHKEFDPIDLKSYLHNANSLSSRLDDVLLSGKIV